MAKNRLIFYSIFGVYQLGAFIFTFVIDTDNTSALLSLYGYLPWFKYLSFIGVMLIVIDFVWSWRQISKTRQEIEEFRQENNILKAKIYDIQETKQPSPTATGSK
jgi:hypothetical protein